MIECQFCSKRFTNEDAYQIHLGIGAPAFHDCNSKEEMIAKGMTANTQDEWSIPDRLVKHANNWAHLDTEALELETDLLEAVTDYVYHRHEGLTATNVVGFTEDELERMEIENGYLVFSVEDVRVDSKLEQDVLPVWYVAATLWFQVKDGGKPVQGSTDVYQCYKCGNEWCIEWHAS